MKHSEYPNPHEVVVVHKPLLVEDNGREFNQVQSVIVDGTPLCLTKPGKVVVEAVVGGANYYVTVTLLAKSVNSEAYEPEEKTS